MGHAARCAARPFYGCHFRHPLTVRLPSVPCTGCRWLRAGLIKVYIALRQVENVAPLQLIPLTQLDVPIHVEVVVAVVVPTGNVPTRQALRCVALPSHNTSAQVLTNVALPVNPTTCGVADPSVSPRVVTVPHVGNLSRALNFRFGTVPSPQVIKTVGDKHRSSSGIGWVAARLPEIE